jgi:hypothetical protein
MRTILIPTDYSVTALDYIANLCNHSGDEELNIIFLHVFKLSDSISELLMLSRRSREFEQISDGFYQRCEELKMEYPQIRSFRMEFLYGNGLNMFRNFLETNKIDAVLNLSNCDVAKTNKSGIDPQILIQRCGLPVLNIRPVIVPEKITTPSTSAVEKIFEA